MVEGKWKELTGLRNSLCNSCVIMPGKEENFPDLDIFKSQMDFL